MVVYACNPSYSGGRALDHGLGVSIKQKRYLKIN
jgi:hypothetical protein